MKRYITDRKTTIACTEPEYALNIRLIKLFTISSVYGVITTNDAVFQGL